MKHDLVTRLGFMSIDICNEAATEIARLQHELETQRDSQISAVNQMLAAEQREAKLREQIYDAGLAPE